MGIDTVRLLLVDDDRHYYLLVRDLLSELTGIAVELDWCPTYEAGKRAMDACVHDAYLVDYRLGDRTGLDLMAEVLAAGCDAPIILLTAYQARDLDLHALALGAADYLDKGELTGALLERTIRYALERKRMERTLSQREGRFRALTERSLDIIAVLGLDGTIEYGSPSLERVLGYPLNELVGSVAFTRVHPDDLAEVLARFESIMHNESEPGAIEFRFRHQNGTWRLLEAVGRNFVDDPAVGGIIINARDITERRELEVQLRQAQKMEAIGQLAGGVAHDFNNLLGVITGYTELLLETVPVDEVTRSWLEEIQRAGERAASLTGQLLAFSRRQVVAPQIVRLDAVIGNVEPMLRRLIGEHITLRHLPDPDDGLVRVDPNGIEQALLNLAINARDAMPGGGTITVETGNVELDADYARIHHHVTPGPHVMLAVSDTGLGMPPDVLAHIFEPFFTTKEPGKGTGLGLATVYGIVKQSGGHIWVYSEPGQGTVFKLYFPRVANPAVAGPPAAAGLATLGTETILVVEDEATLRTLTRSVLERAGYAVLEAGNGDEALALAHAYVAALHLLVTDVVMPGLSGRELAERLVAARPDLRVLFTSGYTDDAIVRHGVLERGAAFLQKPFTPRNLLAKVREVLDRSA